MNTLIHLIAVLLMTYATWWFLDKNAPVVALGTAGVGLMLMVWLLQSIIEDVTDATNSLRIRRGRGRQSRIGRQ